MRTTLQPYFILFAAYFLSSPIFAQYPPLNQLEYNVELVWSGAMKGPLGGDGGTNQADPAWIAITANDTDGSSTSMLNVSPQAIGATDPNLHATCFWVGDNDSPYWHPVGEIPLGIYTNNTTGFYDFHVMSFENDVVALPNCTFHSGDENMGWLNDIRPIYFGSVGIDNIDEIFVNNGGGGADGSGFRFRRRWRYTNGTKDSPLDFGLIANVCPNYIHSNSTNRVTNADPNTYYSNTWTSADNQNFSTYEDVTYRFELDGSKPMHLNFSSNTAGFAPLVHLVSLNSNGDLLQYIDNWTPNAAGGSLELQTGIYALVVQSADANAHGDFTIALEFKKQCALPVGFVPSFPDDIIYVDDDAPGDGDGSSWANAFCDLQFALAYADETSPSTPIWVASGTYHPSHCDESISYDISDAIKLYGGFAGNEAPNYNLSLRDFQANETILSGEIGDPNSTDDNIRTILKLVDVSRETIVDGFTITKANNVGAEGGGCCVESNTLSEGPSFNNLQFISNTASYGGAISLDNSGLQLKSCYFENNHATFWGGAFHAFGNHSKYLDFIDCAFEINTSGWAGWSNLCNKHRSHFHQLSV